MVPGGGMGSMGPAPPHGAQLHQFRGVTPPYVSTQGFVCLRCMALCVCVSVCLEDKFSCQGGRVSRGCELPVQVSALPGVEEC